MIHIDFIPLLYPVGMIRMSVCDKHIVRDIECFFDIFSQITDTIGSIY